MQYFINREFEINDETNKDLLLKISNALFCLSNSSVFENRLAIGGFYHKNYYETICKGFYNGNNIVFNAKNALLTEFKYNLKYNLCNYGVYFYKKENKVFLKIYSGNTFLLDENQINFVEKFINTNKSFCGRKIKFYNFINFYEKNIVSHLKPFNFMIECKNEHLLKQIKRYNLRSSNSNKIIIYENLNYDIFTNKQKINKNLLFKNFKKYDIIDEELIEKINLENITKVIDNNFLIFNKITNSFDILKTLKYLSWRITYDKNNSKLARNIAR